MISRATHQCRRRASNSRLGLGGSFTTIRQSCSSPFRASFSSIPTLPVDEVIIDTTVDPNQVQLELKSIVAPYYKKQQPVVVRGAVTELPATKLWSSWDYLETTCLETEEGDPLVSVEIGGSYGGTNSERAEIPFSAYLQFLRLFEERHGRMGKGYLENDPIPNEELVYMAQNDLLPPLYKDILIPDFCQCGDDDDNASSAGGIGLGRLYSVMMWLGPRGCVSPLHYDPLDNCFLQHMGRKRVLLFEPKSGNPWHYAGHNGQQSNTSPIDPEILDVGGNEDSSTSTSTSTSSTTPTSEEKELLLQDHRNNYPLFFEEAPNRMECLLEAGDFLYIPSKWWHHVRSIDTSASVNVWWR